MNEKKNKDSSPKAKSEPRGIGTNTQTIILALLAIFTGLVIGGIVIAVSDIKVIEAWRNFFGAPGAALAATWNAVSKAYGALFSGSLGSPAQIVEGFRSYFATGDNKLL
ncbi:MAG TPA: hypothetical protein VIV15_12040, partial [Anaerolineales bacterium]